MTGLAAARERTDEVEVIEAKHGVHFEEPTTDDDEHNYRLTTRDGGRTYAHAQTLNLNGAHPAHFPPGTEIGTHPGCTVTLVVDPTFNGENGGPLVWVYLDTDE